MSSSSLPSLLAALLAAVTRCLTPPATACAAEMRPLAHCGSRRYTLADALPAPFAVISFCTLALAMTSCCVAAAIACVESRMASASWSNSSRSTLRWRLGSVVSSAAASSMAREHSASSRSASASRSSSLALSIFMRLAAGRPASAAATTSVTFWPTTAAAADTWRAPSGVALRACALLACSRRSTLRAASSVVRFSASRDAASLAVGSAPLVVSSRPRATATADAACAASASPPPPPPPRQHHHTRQPSSNTPATPMGTYQKGSSSNHMLSILA
mmetsp:Transcript_9481/g.22548  ORF Transcript_9481/g.22548 Transcript_9481/m.22548 type:complete len:275 (-) Transcript_9481:329-1153(-)